MIYTKEQKRDIAEQLRHWGSYEGKCKLINKYVCGVLGVEGRDALNMLADLIEPEEQTCHMIRDHLTDTVFCDVCGERFDGVAQYMAMGPNGFSPADYKGKYKDAKFCPNCGAKVVGE